MSKITPYVYISGVEELVEYCPGFEKMNVRYVICCVDPRYIIAEYRYVVAKNPNLVVLFLPMNDDYQQNLFSTEDTIQMRNSHTYQFEKLYRGKPFLDVANHFINYAISQGSAVWVHCMAGISRSVSVVAYYLMRKTGKSYEEVLQFIQSRRSIAGPNRSFAAQLKKQVT